MRGASGIGMGITIKHLRRTTSGAAGNGLGAMIKYLRSTTSAAANNGLSITITPPCSAAAFVVNSEHHNGARPSVRLCVRPELARCVHLCFIFTIPCVDSLIFSIRIILQERIVLVLRAAVRLALLAEHLDVCAGCYAGALLAFHLAVDVSVRILVLARLAPVIPHELPAVASPCTQGSRNKARFA